MTKEEKNPESKYISDIADFLKGDRETKQHIFFWGRTLQHITATGTPKENKGVKGPMGHPYSSGGSAWGGKHRGAEAPPLSQPPQNRYNLR